MSCSMHGSALILVHPWRASVASGHALADWIVVAATDPSSERRRRLAAARLYLVCDAAPGGRELADVLRAAAAGGVDIVQLRDKRLSDDELARHHGRRARPVPQLGLLLVVNDRPSVAAEAGADGVHLGQDDEARRRCASASGREMLIGLSTHTPRAGRRARQAPTTSAWARCTPRPTKPGRAAVGLDLVRYAAAHAPVPFFAIGGIDGANVTDLVDAGARRVAVMRAIADAADPQRAARTLRVAARRAASARPCRRLAASAAGRARPRRRPRAARGRRAPARAPP